MQTKHKVITTLWATVLLSCLIPATIAYASVSESWQDAGIPDTQWYTDQTDAGQGGSDAPYVIDTAAELAGLASLVNNGNKFADKHIMLDDDIDLADKEWVPIGTIQNSFQGIFNGAGHIVSNVTVEAESDQYAGLFGFIREANGTGCIKNVGVVNVNFSGSVRDGGALTGMLMVDGYYRQPVFENCFSTGNISSTLTVSSLGGLIGNINVANAQNSSAIIRNCYSACNLSDACTNTESFYTRYIGGLIGRIYNIDNSAPIEISNCYTSSRVQAFSQDRNRMGGFIGHVNTTNNVSITQCLFDTQAAGISYAFSSAGSGVSFAGAEGKLTAELTGTGALPGTWDGTTVWQDTEDLYPQLQTFSGSLNTNASEHSLVSAIPLFLYENAIDPALSDTRSKVAHSFSVPAITDADWSADPAGILTFSDNNAVFASPTVDTAVTITIALPSGTSKEFSVLCKGGIISDDTTPPTVVIGDITPSDFSASIPVTADETSTMYVLVRTAAEAAPSAGEIVADSKTVTGDGTAFTASVISLQHSTACIAYAIALDAAGNCSSVVSKPFTTELDHTPPSWKSYSSPARISEGSAYFDCSFNETGTFKFVVLPSTQSAPTKQQIAAGQDAAGNSAFAGEIADVAANASTTVSFSIVTFAPGNYTVYLVCVDAYGNISAPINIAVQEIQGAVTFTVTDGTTAIAGASVTIGATTQTTDGSGQTTFSELSGGSYTYLTTVSGFGDASGSFALDAQQKYIFITMGTTTQVDLSAAVADGASDTSASTKIDLTFSGAISGLTADHITITNDTGAVVKGALSGSGTAWSIALDSVTTQGNVNVAVSAPAGYTITAGSPKTVAVYKDITVPTWMNNTVVQLTGSTASFSCAFYEAGTFKYVVLPFAQSTPTKQQIAAGQNAAGNSAFSGELAYLTAETSSQVSFDVSTLAPGNYKVYLVCVDAAGNISDAIQLSVPEIKGAVTFTVTDGTTAISGASVTIGATTQTTDGSGQTTFSELSGGSYSYLVTASGYDNVSGSFTLDAQQKSISVTMGATTQVALSAAVADGVSDTSTSTKIDLTFSGAISGLTADHITITSGTGAVVKGALSGSGTTWSIALDSVTTQGNVNVAVSAPAGYTITSGSPKTVAVYKAAATTTYPVTFISNGVTYTTRSVTAGQCIDNSQWPADPTRDNYTFGGWFTGINGTGSEFTQETAVNAATTIYAKWTATGGDTPSKPKQSPPAADFDAGNGVTTTLSVTVDKGDRNASVDLGSQAGGLSEGENLRINLPAISGVDSYSVALPMQQLSASATPGTLTIDTDLGSLIIPSDMLTGIAAGDGRIAEITIGEGDKSALPEVVQAALGDRPLIQLSLSINGRQTDWDNPGAPVTVSIPYTPTAEELAHPESIVIWYIDGSGSVVTIPNGHYDPLSGTVVFDVTHFSDYAVAYTQVIFPDVAPDAWYSQAVSFIAARGITTGAGNGNFNPQALLTRGEFLVMLMRTYDIAPEENPTDNFADAGQTYYTGYLAAAKKLEISAGIGNNMFAPDQAVTREEMFTLLYNALNVLDRLPQADSGRKLSDFNDASQISFWAQDALTLFVESGTISGSNGSLAPAATTTRAEMAQVLYNLLGE